MSSTRAPRARSSAVAKAQRAGNGSRTVWIIVAVVVVLGFAAVMAVALAQEDTSSSAVADQTGDISVSGEALPLLGPDGPGDALGRTAPELSGTSLDGDAMQITNDGRPKVVGFFTHWCQHCRAEVPEVSEWYNAGGAPDDVDLYAVSTDVTPGGANYPPSAWFDREDWGLPTMRDDRASSAAAAFGLSGYPFWVAIDADGTVVDQRSGRIGIETLEAIIDMARQGS